MIRNTSPAMLAATAIVSLAIGFGAATLLPAPSNVIEPIVDANAWEEEAPAALAEPVGYNVSAHAKCDPFNVSDVAMEEVLDQMMRRGWRAPNQGDAIALLDTAGATSLAVVDPNAPMPSRRTWTASDAQSADVEIEEDGTATEPQPPAEPEAAPPQPEERVPPPA